MRKRIVGVHTRCFHLAMPSTTCVSLENPTITGLVARGNLTTEQCFCDILSGLPRYQYPPLQLNLRTLEVPAIHFLEQHIPSLLDFPRPSTHPNTSSSPHHNFVLASTQFLNSAKAIYNFFPSFLSPDYGYQLFCS